MAPLARQFQSIPETKEFPAPKWFTLSGQPPAYVYVVSPPERMVCHMVVVPVDPDVDPEILVPVPENAPKGTMKIVEPPCDPTPRR